MGILSALEPAYVFRYFEEICEIPHGSGDTKRISDYCVGFAKEHGLRYLQDNQNNVIIWKDGTAGYEKSAPVMLQGHLDMVCEKEAGHEIDFSRDGLELQLEDGIIRAKGTTLGGDDGIAVAYALAILASEDIPHPPLEVVLTVDEEIGMLGAAALDTTALQAKTMLNMDSEEEGYLLVSCAGGITVTTHLPVMRESTPQTGGDENCDKGIGITLMVTGLQGGHSGVEIDKGRGNACQLLGRILCRLKEYFDFRLCSVQGGLKDNAIPREAVAEIVLMAANTSEESATSEAGEIPKREKEESVALKVLVQEFQEKIEELQQIFVNEYAITDPDIKIICKCTENGTHGTVMDADSTMRTIAMLIGLPGGIQKMSFAVGGLVQTSLNLGILKTTQTEVTASFSVRSSVESEKLELVERMGFLMQILQGSISSAGEYPAWEYRQESPLRDLMVEVFREQYGHEPVIQALHAGVECGLFAGKIADLDCVSFGPDMKDIHTPKESMDVESVKRCWEYLLEILKRLQ